MLSDGVFAIAATLLVLELKIPESADHLPIAAALLHVIPSLLAYALSFFVIALFWSAYHRAMSLISEVDRPIVYLTWSCCFSSRCSLSPRRCLAATATPLSPWPCMRSSWR